MTKESGNDFFQATDDGLILSTGLNIILGERSSGKTITLDKISASGGNVKYIKQFSLLQKDEEKFNDTNKARLSLIHSNHLSEFREVIEDVVKVDIKKNHLAIDNYLNSLMKFATENEKKDLFAKCVLFVEDSFIINDLKNLDKVIQSVDFLHDNGEYKEIITKYISTDNLKALALELIENAKKATIQNQERTWLNTIINDIKRDLRIKTTGSLIEEIDFYKLAIDELKITKFVEVVKSLKVEREISRDDLGKFAVITSTHPIDGAADLVKIGKDKKTYSTAFAKYNTSPYEYLLGLRELGVEDASLYNFFVKIEAITFNRDGFKVSGGERSEFNLIHEIQDATKYDVLLIDEPESSFDNLFLKREINTMIKDISNLMPVVVVTHNSTVGASIKPNYIAITQKSLENNDFVYRVFSGYPSDQELVSVDGKKIKNLDVILDCLEVGSEAYNERKTQTYDILKNQ